MFRGLRLHPVLQAALTSGTVMAAGDMLCQTIRGDRAVNLKQTARFAVIGCTLHGPYFYHGFRWLDGTFGQATTLKLALKKTAAGQVLIFPVYLVGFFLYMGVLEGLKPRECLAKVKKAVVPTFISGCAFWPVVNTINFMYIPGTKRIMYVNAVGLLWNAFLSWENSTRGAVAQASVR